MNYKIIQYIMERSSVTIIDLVVDLKLPYLHTKEILKALESAGYIKREIYMRPSLYLSLYFVTQAGIDFMENDPLKLSV